jgi:hypothetical protein
MVDSLERVKRCFAFETTDRPPIWDWIRNDTIIEYFTGKPLTIENGRTACMETYRRALDATKQEMRFPQMEGCYCDDDGRRFRQERWTTWVETNRDVMDYDSEVRRMQSLMSRYSGWNEEGQQELDGLLADWREKQEQAYPVMVFPCIGHVGLTEAYEYVGGIEIFAYLSYDRPGPIGDFLSFLCHRTLDRLAHLPCDFRPFAVFVGEDIAYKNGLLFSPRFLRGYFFPHLRKVVERYHSIGARVLFHSDGNAWEVMDDIVDTGIDGFNPIEEASGMSVGLLRERYSKLVLCGGVDVSCLLARGSPADCYRETMKNIRASPRGYLVGGSAEIHNAVRLENYLAMLKAVKDSGQGFD